jgi:hypothetical protein
MTGPSLEVAGGGMTPVWRSEDWAGEAAGATAATGGTTGGVTDGSVTGAGGATGVTAAGVEGRTDCGLVATGSGMKAVLVRSAGGVAAFTSGAGGGGTGATGTDAAGAGAGVIAGGGGTTAAGAEGGWKLMGPVDLFGIGTLDTSILGGGGGGTVGRDPVEGLVIEAAGTGEPGRCMGTTGPDSLSFLV